MCYTPYIIKNPKPTGGKTLPVPCGKCQKCLQNKANQWHFRLRQESKRQDKAKFITLTYNTTHVPLTPKGYMSLNKEDVTKWLKRLRKAHVKRYGKEHRIKYYLCGEYGSKTERPHYHAIMFNIDEDLVINTWQLGNCHFGDVEGASIMYTLKYMVKPSKIPKHENDDREPEKARMSQNMGSNYITPEIIEWHQKNINRNYVVDNEYKLPLPRYYRERIYTEEQRTRQRKRIIKKKEKQEEKRYRDFKRKYGDDMDKYAWRQHQRKINAIKWKDVNINRDKI